MSRAPSVRLGFIVAALLALTSACAVKQGAVRGDSGRGQPGGLERAHREPDLVTEPGGSGQGGQVRHVVEPGQTLYRIARTYEIPVDDLMKANGISDPRALSVGQTLVVPGVSSRREVVPPGAQEAPEAIAAARPGVLGGAASQRGSEGDDRGAGQKSTAPARAPRPKAVEMPKGSGVIEWPLRGMLYARFGKKGRERHDGIDLAAPLGTPVKTAKAGKVLYAGEQKGYGLIAIVDHGEGLITLYAHNRDLRVKTGQKVRDGQVIATVGESGRTSGPHLHFEVRRDGVPVDPLKVLGAPPERLGRRAPDGR